MVTVTPYITIASADTTICLGSSAQLNATAGAASYSWAPASDLSNPNAQDPTASPASSTTYAVLAINSAGCTGTDSVTVTVQQATATASNDTLICLGDTIQLAAGGGISYMWTPSAGLNNPATSSPLAFPSATTDYVVTVYDNLGCEDKDTVRITVSAVNAVAGPDTTVCAFENVQLVATGGSYFSWSPATTLNNPSIANPTATPSAPTVFSVLVTDVYGCTGTDSVSVNTFPSNFANAGADLAICDGFSAPLHASGGVGFSWQPAALLNNPSIATPLAFVDTTTDFTVTVTSADGCVDDDTVHVTVLPRPTVVAVPSDTSICLGDTTGLMTVGASSYSWTPPAGLSNPSIPNPLATPATSMSYIVTGTGSNGCTASDTVVIQVLPLPTANAGPDVSICNGDTAQLNGLGGIAFQWSPATTLSDSTISNPTSSPASSTTYTLAVIDANGCADTDEVLVTVNSPPTASAGSDISLCPGDSTLLSGSGGVSYVWSPAAGLSDPNVASPTASPVSSTQYVLTATDINGCRDTDTMTITINPFASVNAGADVQICPGTSTQLLGSGGVNYAWSPAAGLSDPNIASPTASPVSSTQYVLTATDSNGCQGTDTMTVTINALPAVSAGADVQICAGASTQLSATGGVSYLWVPPIGLSDPSIANPIASVVTTTVYTVTATDGNGCENSDSIIVSVLSALPANAGPDQTICAGDAAQLVGSGGVIFSWLPVSGLSDPSIANPVAQPANTTTYTLTVTDTSGCQGSDSVTILVSPSPAASAGPDVSGCAGIPLQLNASGGLMYAWSPATGLSDPTIANPVATPATTTSYTVSVTDANGCSDTATVLVTVLPSPVADAGPDQELCSGDTASLMGSGGLNYSWQPAVGLSDPGVSNPLAYPVTSTTFTLTITDVNGCSDADQVDITVNPAVIASAGQDQTIVLGTSVVLQGSGGVSYLWNPVGTLSNPFSQNPVATPVATTLYYVVVTSVDGCTGSDSVMITVVNPTVLEMPTAFTPNGDGLNDVFIPAIAGGLTLERFAVYNRWGDLVFETTDLSQGWDGRCDGVEQPIGAYAFTLRGRDTLNRRFVSQGSVTLLR
jgi:gliding motility-associated-like protein